MIENAHLANEDFGRSSELVSDRDLARSVGVVVSIPCAVSLSIVLASVFRHRQN